jgi:tight adherence protein C
MALIISIGLFAFLALAITTYGYYHFARPGRVFAHLGGETPQGVMDTGNHPQFYGVVNVLKWAGEKVPLSASEASYLKKYMMMGGFRDSSALPIYYGVKIACAAGMGFVAVLSRQFWTPPGALAIVLPLVAAGIGYMIPSLVLDWIISRRQEELRLSLPDALDLMVVCVEAGLGLDQAIRSVSTELRITHPELCNELSLMSLEMRAGTNRATALNNLAERTGETEIRKLVAVLVQTDRFGTSMADALRTHSEFMRIRRRQEAEERANKIAVKLIFPIFFFILPSMIIVAAGPGLLQLFKHLFPLMRDVRF